MSQENDTVIIYTDGGCEPNPGVGGWAAILIYNGKERELSGSDPETTNNRMEMTAAISGLEALKRPCNVQLITDSEYVKRGITEWLPGWKRRNWKRKGGPIKNVDLWKQLDEATQRHDISWQWVKGHAGVHYNERCDTLASEAIAREKQSIRSGRST